jgi:putative hydrolase
LQEEKNAPSRFYGDYHTHTRYSDASTSVEDNIVCALNAGLKEIAITDHGFNNPRLLSLRYEKLLAQRKEIERVSAKYPQLSVIQGVEADLIGADGTIDVEEWQYDALDVLIAGLHRWAKPKSASDFFKLYFNANTYMPGYFKKPKAEQLVKNTDAAVRMLEKNPVDIYPHINNFLFVDAAEVAKACAHFGTFLEFNVKHIKQLQVSIDAILASDVKIIFSSDAHKHGEVGNFSVLEDFAKQCGLDMSRVVNAQLKRPDFRFARYKAARNARNNKL